MHLHSFRLKPSQDLRAGLLGYAQAHNLQAASVVTCVGGLQKVVLRMAGATPDKQDIRTYEGKFEIISLVGTLSREDCHLHLALSDKEGKVIGGHLKAGSLVSPTAEIVLIEDTANTYLREPDEQTGFEELIIRPRV